MSRSTISQTYLLRVQQHRDKLRLTMQDLRSGRMLSFSSWQELIRYVESHPPTQRLR